jgi:hypothetical protein
MGLVPVELVGGDGREGKEGSRSQRPPATEILAAVRHADASPPGELVSSPSVAAVLF